jgi:hypothetical protein
MYFSFLRRFAGVCLTAVIFRDLCNMASALAIGVFTDNQTMVDWAISQFTEVDGTGNINHFVWEMHEEDDSGKLLGQSEESGRDQVNFTRSVLNAKC